MSELKFYLIFTLLFYSCWSVSESNAQTWAMNKTSSSQAENEQDSQVSIIEALNELSQTYEVFFTYNTARLKTYKVSTEYRQAKDVNSSLKKLLEKSNLRFKKRGKNNFVIVEKTTKPVGRLLNDFSLPQPVAPQIPQLSDALEKTITGTVTDLSTGETLPGVNILVKGTTIGTITDVEGNYRLTAPDDAQTLVFSSVGYTSEEVAIGDQTIINLEMAPDIQSLSEIVVIGYGTTRRKDLTGAVSSVNNEELVSVPTLGLDQALQGRAAGVNVTQTQAEPGGNIKIRIRGSNSIQGDNEPLYVIDGFIGGNISTVDPSDIASINVLKDASSTAIYGTRGANGVVLITTKSGKPGKPVITIDSYYGLQQVSNTIDLMNAEQFASFTNASRVADGEEAPFDLQNLPANTDWQDEMFRTAPIQNYNVGVSGAADNLNYYTSLNYINQEGVMIGTGYDRFNFRTNLDVAAAEKLNLGAKFGLSVVNNQRALSQVGFRTASFHQPLVNALLLPATASPYNPDGSIKEGALNALDVLYINPVNTQLNQDFEQNSKIFNGNIYGEYEIFSSLRFKSVFGLDLDNTRVNQFRPSTVYDSSNPVRNFASNNSSLNTNWLSESYLTYSNDWDNHSLEFLVGTTIQKNRFENVFAQTSDFSVDTFGFSSLQAGNNIDNISSTIQDWSRLSYYSRVFYKFRDKYLVTLNGRYDGSSRFGKDNKWGFFPSGAIAWRLDNEEFIQNLNVFQSLKLRASYGITGSDALSPYQSIAALNPLSDGYNLNGAYIVGFVPIRLANPDLKWETTAQFDLGLDVAMLNNRLQLTLDYYDKTTEDLFLNEPLPLTSGVGFLTRNIGSVSNRGFEASIGTSVGNEDFNWNIDFNFAYNKTEILDLGGVDEILTGDIGGTLKLGNSQALRVGEELGSFFGYEVDGVWQTGEATYQQFGSDPVPGDLKFVDISGDGNVDDADRTILGNANPNFYGGFNNSITFKGFDVTAFLQYSFGSEVLNANNRDLLNPADEKNKLAVLTDYWTPENPSTSVPRPNYNRPTAITGDLVEDASFIRLREFTIGYSFPQLVQSWEGVSRLRVYVTGTNLFTLTDYSGYDPEVNVFGGNTSILATDYGAYPKARMVMIGLNLSL